jgi:hypothetical protein
MVPTSTPYIYKAFETIHMLWMGRWVHHHATTTILVAAEFRELADFLGHSDTTNDVKVQWLRPKTHMEWFLHPLHTYTRCLRPFICCGWGDGSTITPLPPYLYAPNLGSWLISWVTARLQMMQGWIGWGPRPTWNGSHIHSIHIQVQGVWDHS